jgi:hypothetical protein
MSGANPDAPKRVGVRRQNNINIQTHKRVKTATLDPRDRGGNLDPKIGGPKTKNRTYRTNSHKNPRDRSGNLRNDNLRTQKQPPPKVITKN